MIKKKHTSETPVCGCTAVLQRGPERRPPQSNCSGSWRVKLNTHINIRHQLVYSLCIENIVLTLRKLVLGSFLGPLPGTLHL